MRTSAIRGRNRSWTVKAWRGYWHLLRQSRSVLSHAASRRQSHGPGSSKTLADRAFQTLVCSSPSHRGESRNRRRLVRTNPSGSRAWLGHCRNQIELHGPVGSEPHVQLLDLTEGQHLDVTFRVGPIDEAIVIPGERPQSESGQPGAQPRRIRVGGNVRNARPVHYVPSTYPAEAGRRGVEGIVCMEAGSSRSQSRLGRRGLATRRLAIVFREQPSE